MKTYLLERIEKEDTHTLGRFWFEGEVVYKSKLTLKYFKPEEFKMG